MNNKFIKDNIHLEKGEAYEWYEYKEIVHWINQKVKDGKFVNLESSFGNLTVYFDEAKLSEGSVHISVENSFGKMSLFVPKEWDTNVNVDRAFGNVSEIGRPTRESEAKVYIEGETNFGQLEINYI